jgi:hypothetical protein
MVALQNTIMSDNSRLFATIDNKSLSEELLNHLPSGKTVNIEPTINNKYEWADFNYKNEAFTIFNCTGDLMFFADNCDCSEKILSEVLDLIDQ